MKKSVTAMLMALGLGLPAMNTMAQDANQPPPSRGPRPPQHEGGPAGEGQRPPPPPLIGALDANHDGVIDASEIDNASAALRKLDKNGDGQLSMDEVRPPRPGGPGGPGGPGVGPHDDGQPPADGQPRPQRPRRPRPAGE